MKFIEWLLKIPRRLAGSEFFQLFAVVLSGIFLLAWLMWYIVRGPQILALIPLSIGLYIIYYFEENVL